MISNNNDNNNRNSICNNHNVNVNAIMTTTTTNSLQTKEKLIDNNNSFTNKTSQIIIHNNQNETAMDQNLNAFTTETANTMENNDFCSKTNSNTNNHKISNNVDRKSIISTSSSYAATDNFDNTSDDDHLNGNDTSAIETEDDDEDEGNGRNGRNERNCVNKHQQRNGSSNNIINNNNNKNNSCSNRSSVSVGSNSSCCCNDDDDEKENVNGNNSIISNDEDENNEIVSEKCDLIKVKNVFYNEKSLNRNKNVVMQTENLTATTTTTIMAQQGNDFALLSPNEGPLARRYAEIVQFRSPTTTINKWYEYIFLYLFFPYFCLLFFMFVGPGNGRKTKSFFYVLFLCILLYLSSRD
jgi:hypothetical protein